MSDPQPFWALAADEVVHHLETDAVAGLRSTEATGRLERYGANVLETIRRTPWYTVFSRQFFDVLILILLVAAAISLLTGEAGDAATIVAIVAFNGVLGFIQEWKAENAIAALRRMLSPQCRVVRDGSEAEVDAQTLVPGDVVVLEIGDRVPADLRLIEALNVKVDESTLTGESGSVAKTAQGGAPDTPLSQRSSMAWMGTAVTNGRARGVVTATGMLSEFGRIAQLTQAVDTDKTPLQKRLAVVARQLGVLSIVVSALVAGAGWLAGKSLSEMFLTGVSLAVAVVPEGLPAVVTITMALGIRAMVKRRVLLHLAPSRRGSGDRRRLRPGRTFRDGRAAVRFPPAAGSTRAAAIRTRLQSRAHLERRDWVARAR